MLLFFQSCVIMHHLFHIFQLFCRENGMNGNQSGHEAIADYRNVECIMSQLNNCFKLYLATFPTILFSVVALLLFGVIRIWKNDPGSNLMFPLCGARCFYEAITPLSIAGVVNEENKRLIMLWKKKRVVAGSGPKEVKLMKTYAASLNGVRCRSGSLYTFENGIVLCCLNNLMQLTLNLLITFKQY